MSRFSENQEPWKRWGRIAVGHGCLSGRGRDGGIQFQELLVAWSSLPGSCGAKFQVTSDAVHGPTSSSPLSTTAAVTEQLEPPSIFVRHEIYCFVGVSSWDLDRQMPHFGGSTPLESQPPSFRDSASALSKRGSIQRIETKGAASLNSQGPDSVFEEYALHGDALNGQRLAGFELALSLILAPVAPEAVDLR